MIDLRYVKKLIEMLDESTVDSIEISSEKGMKIRIGKTPQQRGGVQVAAPMMQPIVAAPAVAQSAPSLDGPAGAGNGNGSGGGAVESAAAKSNLLEVKSPMVGTYYSAPEPGAKQYASVGDRVTKGKVLCIIEAMKIMNEIESEVDGVVKEVLLDNAHPVEYGQVLFRIDPNG